MCGIVGFLAKESAYRSTLGEYVVPMMECMGDRGPDSAGLAIFSEKPDPKALRFNLYALQQPFARDSLARRFEQAFGAETSAKIEEAENHAVLITSVETSRVVEWIRSDCPDIHLLSVGRAMDIYKDTGHPREIAARYRWSSFSGSHCVGHTRMATESAVTPVHSHPFTAGQDFCLVHNGSLSNPYELRRMLEARGVEFETDNDTEAACRFLQWRLAEGDTIEEALEQAFVELDGFFTLLMGTVDKIVLVRDAFACKPAVVAETDDYVAIGSEFRTLAHLPNIQNARLFEPRPEEIYSWNV